MQLTEKQQMALDIAVARYKAHEPWTCISGYAGSGKAQPIDTKIPTPNGYMLLKDIKVGDYVFDRTGQPTKVLGVYPQGEQEIYSVQLSDNRTTLCAGDHLWSYYTSKGNLYSKTTKEMLDSGLENSSGFKYKIPVNKPVQYSHKDFKLDPYFLGVFLGDGCCLERYLTLSSENDEIPNMIGNIINARPIKNSEHNYSWSFEWINKTKTVEWTCAHNAKRTIERVKPKTEDYFKEYEKYIMVHCTQKDIPEEYKYGSIEQRYALVQGLMDTDGSIASNDDHRYNLRFTSTSLKLIKSFQEILFSLGYSSTITEDKRTEKYSQNICYGLMINVSNQEKYKFFRLSRKKDIALKAINFVKHKDYSKISITNIIPLNKKTEMICIYVDNKEHLYLTNDYITTHNTTVVKFIIAALHLPPESVAYITFTGKAASVLQHNGCPNAMTAHKLLYYARKTPQGKFTFSPKTQLDEPYSLIVVDEVSMLPVDLWNLLLTHHVPVIALGDPCQLPPVVKSTDNHVLDNPHIFLDEIMRQAAGNEIIQLSMNIRNEKPIRYNDQGKDAMVIPAYKVVSGMYDWADQIICATNRQRQAINNYMRAKENRGPEAENGDKVICCNNCWEILDTNMNMALVNGTIGYLQNVKSATLKYPILNCPPVPVLIADLQTDTELFKDIVIDKTCLETGKKFLTPQQEYAIYKSKNPLCPPAPIEFNYGYAITCHRAQGSQWDKVLVFEEDFPFPHEEHKRWLYTATTRAASRLVLVR